jgi:hypothetical protein
MLYNLVITTQTRKLTQPQVTQIQAQNIFESHIRDGVDFTIKVSEHVCEHKWNAVYDFVKRELQMTCERCDGEFEISDTVLAACYDSGQEAKKHGF